MTPILLSLVSIYTFVLLGFACKKIFKEQIHERSFTILSVNFLQPILIFWGILKRPLDIHLVLAPVIFMAITIFVVVIVSLVAYKYYKHKPKKRSIVTMTSVLGNSGTLGITSGLVILGPESVPFTSMMNLINIFFCFSFGAYVYSRGSFSIRESIYNVFKLPIIWTACLALLVNALQIPIHEQINTMLEIGAHGSIAVQLTLFGMYLSSANIKKIQTGLATIVCSIKFIALPVLGFFILQYVDIPIVAKGAILLELMVPMAVNNINLASLYDCEPETVTELTFISSLLFIVVLPIGAIAISSF